MSIKTILIGITALMAGFIAVYVGMLYSFRSSSMGATIIRGIAASVGVKRHEVVGFLPYWLIDKADKDYTKYLSQLSYFGLTLNPDGSIQKFTRPGESEPGWHTLNSGKVDNLLSHAKKSNIRLSLLVFSGKQEAILELVRDPVAHAATLVSEVAPIMKQYGFTDLNLDIESVVPYASPEATANFTIFVREVRKHVDAQKLGTITIDSSPTDLIKERLINLKSIEPYVDYVVLMTYDYHYTGSAVTGPVAPIGGAGIDAEFDTETGIQKALAVIPKHKILLGIPLYGYEWETIQDKPRSAIMPGSGQTISNRRVEKLLATCATCSANLDPLAQESYILYQDSETNMFHQAFYPDTRAVGEKIKLANKYELGGAALWALGYEGDSILLPLESYKQSLE